LNGGQYRPLDDDGIKAVHETSLRVFSEIGIKVNNKEAFKLFESAGAHIDRDTSIVKIDPDLVMDLIRRAPDTIVLHGRKPEHILTVGGKRVFAGTGGSALYVMDPGSDEKRPALLSDLKDIARVVDSLKNIHFFMLPVIPGDVSEENMDVNRFGIALAYCSKHIMGGVYTVEGVRNVIRMAEIIAGSREALVKNPIISMVTCCSISPFVLDDKYSGLTIEVARSGIPVVTPAEPLCGATSPITLAGNLVVQNVDTLAGVMLSQIANPGAPVFYGCISSIVDMKDMKYLSGAVEMGLMNAAASQLAHFYKLPIYATAGMTDSKTIDAQAGIESAVTSVMVSLAGGNFIHDAAGFIEFCMCASLEKYVLDDDILGMAMRAVEGIKVNPETLAFDVLKNTGPGGHFVSDRHTRKFMRKEQYKPTICDRSQRDTWRESGKKDARKRAQIKVRKILSKPEMPVLDEKILEAIRHEIPGIAVKALEGAARW